MNKTRHYSPNTIEDALRDMKEWSAHKTRNPEATGGVIISEALMRNICMRILVLEKAAL